LEDEAVIAKGLQSFYDVGLALLRIRDSKSYKEVAGYNTFQQYCKDKWDMGRSRAYQLIDAYNLIENLSTIVDTFPQTESQCRPLIQLNPEDQRTVWKKIIDTGEKITAKLVYETVEEFQARDLGETARTGRETEPEQEEMYEEEDESREEREQWCKEYEQTDNQESKELTDEEKDKLTEILYVGYRILSKKYNPDTGGSTKDMIALNKAKNFMLSEISHVLQ
jgi:hypothetical protein